MNNPHVMSKYATELECLYARDKWFQEQLYAHEALLKLCRDALEELFGAEMEHCMMMDGKDDQIAAIKHAKLVHREIINTLGKQ